MGAGRRKLVVGALCACAAFAWGCESKRAAPEGGDNARMQPPSMSAPDGERSAGSGETLRRGQMPEENGTPNPAELPGGREMRGFGGAGEEGSSEQRETTPGSSTHPVDEECAEAPATAEQPQQRAPQQQPQPGAQQQGAGTGGAGPDQGNTGVAPEESRAVRDEATTIIVPGQGGEGLDAATLKDAERAAQDAREGDSDERIVIANVEFGGRLQEVGPERVVVRDAEGNLYEAQLGEESSVKRDRLREGMQVRASLDLVEGAYVVRELEPVRRGQRAQPQPQTTQPQPDEAR